MPHKLYIKSSGRVLGVVASPCNVEFDNGRLTVFDKLGEPLLWIFSGNAPLTIEAEAA